MTAPKNTYRRRKKSSLGNIPRDLLEWFSGERDFSFYAYVVPYCFSLQDHWDAWKQEHPDAVMPDNLEYALKRAAKVKERAKKRTKNEI